MSTYTSCTENFKEMEIRHSTSEDIERILALYRSAAEYQRRKGYNIWHEFAPRLIETEIREAQHFKIAEGADICCVFTVAYSDPVIWSERDKDPAVYLHRIATNPDFKGKGIMHLIKKWASDHAKQQQKRFLRLDTWGDNENLKNYYLKCGFNPAGQRTLSAADSNGMPSHYSGLTLSLFEIIL